MVSSCRLQKSSWYRDDVVLSYISNFDFVASGKKFPMQPGFLTRLLREDGRTLRRGLPFFALHFFPSLNASNTSLTCRFRLITVQQVCIPTAILNVDVLCQAKSGLGKTAVFVLTTLHQLEAVPGECSILVMCHTRELAYQIKNEYARFSKYLPDVKTAVFYGGTPIQKDIETLSNKDSFPNIIVGTPGRLNALVRDKKLSLRNVKAFVLDECDKMLDQIGTYSRNYSYPLF